MYEEYFGLSGPPFKLSPDPRFFFGSRSHNKAMAYLHYGLKQAEGFIVITGAVGAGKTMLIGHLLDQLNSSTIHAAQLLTSNIEPEELLSHILSAFRIEPEEKGRTGQLEAFEDYLFDQLNRGRRVLLIVDEAQNLPHRTLEELRMLSNMDYDGTPLFQVFLVGQPEFRTMMESDRLEQLKQRVIASYHLEGLSQEESREYILHRLGVAGWKDDPAFSEDAFEAIYTETEGRPRRINTLANRLLLYCALEKRHEITAEIVNEVAAELRDEKLASGKKADNAPATDAAQAEGDAPVKDEAPVKEEAPPAKAAPAKKQSASGRKSETAARTTSETLPETPVEIALKKASAAKKGEGSDVMAEDDKKDVKDTQDVAKAPDEKKGAQKDDWKKAKTEPAPDAKPSAPAAPSPAPSSSVLDRVNAKREDADNGFDDDAPTEATLSDVATAIAAASAGEADVDVGAAPENGDWRKSLARSVNEARDELKDANGAIKKLHQALSADAKRHDKRREKALANLTRAETMLSEIRAARR